MIDKKALRRAIREMVRTVFYNEIGKRLLFCRAGRHFFFAKKPDEHVRGCEVCVFRAAFCGRHGGADAANLSVIHHAAWFSGTRGRAMYGSAHAEARAALVGQKRRKRA